MHFIIDGYPLAREQIFGIHRFALEILREMDEMLVEEDAELVVPNFISDAFIADNLCYKKIKTIKIGQNRKHSFKYGRVIDKAIWDEITFPRYAGKAPHAVSVDLMLDFPNGKVDIISIHDCIPELFPPENPTLKYKLHVFQLKYLQKRGIRNCKTLLTVSEYSKKDIQKVYNTKGKRIVVIHNAWQHFQRIPEEKQILERLNLAEGQYFFSLGSRLHHKNAKWILAAAKNNPQYSFVITGSSFNRKDPDVSKNTCENVIFTGYLRDSEVKALMHYCKAFIQPSLVEGFGIPPMEAMSVGADCIVSNVTALPEIYKNSVWYIDPYDYESIDLNEIMAKEKEQNDAVLNEYDWKKSAKILLDEMREIAKEKNGC